jgi:hypothetical protein
LEWFRVQAAKRTVGRPQNEQNAILQVPENHMDAKPVKASQGWENPKSE